MAAGIRQKNSVLFCFVFAQRKKREWRAYQRVAVLTSLITVTTRTTSQVDYREFFRLRQIWKKSQVQHWSATGTYVTQPIKVTNAPEEESLGSRGRLESKVRILVELSETSADCSCSGCAVLEGWRSYGSCYALYARCLTCCHWSLTTLRWYDHSTIS